MALKKGLKTRWVGILAVAASFFFIILGGIYFIRTQNLINHWLSAKGTVIETTFRTGRANTRYTIIKFQTPDGKFIKFTSTTNYYYGAYKDGETVDVLYNPQDPKDARLNSFNGLWAVTIGLCMMGGFLFLAGMYVLFAKEQ